MHGLVSVVIPTFLDLIEASGGSPDFNYAREVIVFILMDFGLNSCHYRRIILIFQ